MTGEPGNLHLQLWGRAQESRFAIKQQLTKGLIFLVAIVAVATTVRADDLIPIDPDDPETVHIGSGVGTTCATGNAPGCQIWNGDVNGLHDPTSGGVWNTVTGYAGNLTGANSGNNTAYQVANLSAGGSESFVNWSSADQAINGINASFFGIYVYTLNFTPPSWVVCRRAIL